MRTRLSAVHIISFLTLSLSFGCGSGSGAAAGSQNNSSAGTDPSVCINTFAGVSEIESANLEEVCSLTNSERAEVGASQLTLDPKLTELAQAHARDMVQRSYFSHTNPDGQDPFDRLRAASVSYRAAAENIARGQSTPVGVMSSWMNSSGHRTNLLNTRYSRIGVGSYQGYWVQIFTN